MIKVSKHNISKELNVIKQHKLDHIFSIYKECLEYYVDLILTQELPLKTNLSSKLLPSYKSLTHSRYKQLIYKQASEIIRSQLKRASKRRFKSYQKVYTYFKNNGRQVDFINKTYKELLLKPLIKSRYFTKPTLKNITITFDERFFNIKQGDYFNEFIQLKTPLFNDKGTRSLNLNLPLNYHKYSLKLSGDGYGRRNVISIKKINNTYHLNLFWEKEVKKKELHKHNGLGLDIGYKKLLVTSDKQLIGKDLEQIYNKISNKVKGSKSYGKSLTERDNMINYYCNLLEIKDRDYLVVEDLNKVKHKSKLSKKFNNKLQYWSYRKTLDKLERICDEHGITMVKVSPHYTSQMCSSCGHTDKSARNGEVYQCRSCGEEMDADYNASVNIHNKGVYSLFGEENKFHYLS